MLLNIEKKVMIMIKIDIISGFLGAGKTTLINILGLMDEEYEGDYYFLNNCLRFSYLD